MRILAAEITVPTMCGQHGPSQHFGESTRFEIAPYRPKEGLGFHTERQQALALSTPLAYLMLCIFVFFYFALHFLY